MYPLVSVIVPVYNAEKYIHRCLDCLKKQSYKNIEIIIVDDGSIDNSRQIINEFVESDKRFKYYYQGNAGVSAARNKGLAIASGEYVGFCDSDDYIEFDMYECLYNLITKTNSDVSMNSIIFEIEKTDLTYLNNDEVIIYSNIQAIEEMYVAPRKFAGYLCNKLFKRAVVEKIRLEEKIAIFEDQIFVFNAFLNSKKIAYQQLFKYHYVYNSTSACHLFKESSWSAQKACDILYDMVNKHLPNIKGLMEKMIISANLMLANMLICSKKLNKTNYAKIKAHLLKNMDQKELNKYSKNNRNLRFFLKGRKVYILSRSIYDKFLNKKARNYEK